MKRKRIFIIQCSILIILYSFLQVRVEYYDYVNIFVRGNQLKSEEDYGSGGYDPFEREIVPLPERYTYYDDNGKVIKSNW